MVVTDLLYFVSAYWFCNTYYKSESTSNKKTQGKSSSKSLSENVSSAFKDNFSGKGLAQMVLVLTVLNPGLILVDSILQFTLKYN